MESEEERVRRIKKERRESTLENRRKLYTQRFPMGAQIGFLTVTGKPRIVSEKILVDCVCDCGKNKTFDFNYILNPNFHKCGKGCESHLRELLVLSKKENIKNVNDWLKYFRNDNNFNPPIDDNSTQAPPGSKEKIKVMQSRLERGKALFHPDDKKNYKGTKPSANILFRNVKSFGVEKQNRGGKKYD